MLLGLSILSSRSGGLPLSPLLQKPEIFPLITKGPLPDLGTKQGMKGLIVQGFILVHCHHLCAGGTMAFQLPWHSCEEADQDSGD